jgi:hypothetical protein
MKKVCVLGRGKSLLSIEDLPDDALYVTVNRYAEELDDVRISSKLQDKKLHHVSSLSPGELDGMQKNDCFNKFDYEQLVVPYIKETCPGKKLPEFIPSKTLSDNCKQYMFKRGERPDGSRRYAYSFPTSGMAAVCYATVDLDAEEINIIGIDFYDNVGYAFGSEWESDEQGIKYGEDPKMMKDFLNNFMAKFPKKHFNIFTSANFKSELQNVNVYKV